ncbi:MAG: hypothetical protein CVV16_04840 [Gammaproteobacteria bacterium HGW-Gammaproteobacteria-6]|nr:MAG: hypothetical protein CVV16_04840 [Gammaproteobacteria bacterium HGW-Gammaproteobacteria-6]
MANTTVPALLEDIRLLGGEQFVLVEQLRALIKTTIPAATEEVKYGGILFTSGVPFCGIFAYKHHVSVEFSHGARITDAAGHLEGSGKGRRHIKLSTAADVEGKQLALYIQLALEAAQAGKP